MGASHSARHFTEGIIMIYWGPHGSFSFGPALYRRYYYDILGPALYPRYYYDILGASGFPPEAGLSHSIPLPLVLPSPSPSPSLPTGFPSLVLRPWPPSSLHTALPSLGLLSLAPFLTPYRAPPLAPFLTPYSASFLRTPWPFLTPYRASFLRSPPFALYPSSLHTVLPSLGLLGEKVEEVLKKFWVLIKLYNSWKFYFIFILFYFILF